MDDKFEITIWGCRGSSSVSNPRMMGYGCNTPCVSVTCGEQVLVFDGGTGIINFERDYFLKRKQKQDLHIFLTHYHYDHIEGIPFMKIPFDASTNTYFYGMVSEGKNCREILDRAFSPPYFPVQFVGKERLSALHFITIEDQCEIKPFKDVLVKALPIHHNGGAYAYKIKYHNKTFCYLTDYEYEEATYPALSPFIHGCDLLIFDTSFSEETYLHGWGHSTWEKAIAIATQEKVKKLVLFHHNIEGFDTQLDLIKEHELYKSASIDLCVSRDGMVIQI